MALTPQDVTSTKEILSKQIEKLRKHSVRRDVSSLPEETGDGARADGRAEVAISYLVAAMDVLSEDFFPIAAEVEVAEVVEDEEEEANDGNTAD